MSKHTFNAIQEENSNMRKMFLDNPILVYQYDHRLSYLEEVFPEIPPRIWRLFFETGDTGHYNLLVAAKTAKLEREKANNDVWKLHETSIKTKESDKVAVRETHVTKSVSAKVSFGNGYQFEVGIQDNAITVVTKHVAQNQRDNDEGIAVLTDVAGLRQIKDAIEDILGEAK